MLTNSYLRDALLNLKNNFYSRKSPYFPIIIGSFFESIGNIMKLKNRKFIFATHLVLLSGLASCMYIPEKISVEYQSRLQLASIPPLNGSIVSIHVADSRRGGPELGSKKSSTGAEMASIRLQNNLIQEITNALTSELRNAGCTIETGQTLVDIDIQRFCNEFKQGFFTDKGNAEFFMSVSVRKPNGVIVYAKTIMGFGQNPSVWLHSGENARIALNEAFNDALGKLLNDPAFIQSLKP